MYLDLHAHSRKHNIFIYGCESRRNSDRRLQEQVFPLMLHKNAADKVSTNIFPAIQNTIVYLENIFYNFSSLLKTANSEFNVVRKELVELLYGCLE